ncbi:unnamed protein product [Arctia plantaginis]|uniref:Gloverin n=1 Tax=Arctia plantaginis TaxID=874455 RepID=A0A8S0Z2S9_ARCPL|nr:unnamed protein product [Arctia plantaginis]
MVRITCFEAQFEAFLVRRSTNTLSIKMLPTTFVFVIGLMCAYAQVYRLPSNTERYPDNFFSLRNSLGGNSRTWEGNVGRGKVFGTLGSTDGSLFGRGGYKQNIFNDHRGRLEGSAYGSRVLGPTGGSSSMGGTLDWSNDNAKVTADLNREIGGHTGLTVTGEGKWKLDKNTRLEAGGNLQKTFGHDKPDIGLEAKIVHDF